MPISIKDAIEILTDWGVISEPQVDQDLLDAVKLSIKALKRVKQTHEDYGMSFGALLPGETID